MKLSRKYISGWHVSPCTNWYVQGTIFSCFLSINLLSALCLGAKGYEAYAH